MRLIILTFFIIWISQYTYAQETTPISPKNDPVMSRMALRPNSMEKTLVIRNNNHKITHLSKRKIKAKSVSGNNFDKRPGLVLRPNTRDKLMEARNNRHLKVQQMRKQALMQRQKIQMQRRMQIQQRRRIIQRHVLRKKRIQQQIIRRRRQHTR